MIARCSLALLAGAAFLALAAPAYAADSVWGDGVEVMGDQEMQGLRGGLAIAPGIDVSFAAVITTTVNGVPALTTQLTWTDVGAFVEQTVGQAGEQIDALTPEQQQALGVAGLNGQNGVVIADADGVTALVHNVTEGALQNIIINNATGRDISQSVDVTLTLPGFEVMQNSLLVEHLGFHLSDDMQGVIFSPGG